MHIWARRWAVINTACVMTVTASANHGQERASAWWPRRWTGRRRQPMTSSSPPDRLRRKRHLSQRYSCASSANGRKIKRKKRKKRKKKRQLRGMKNGGGVFPTTDRSHLHYRCNVVGCARREWCRHVYTDENDCCGTCQGRMLFSRRSNPMHSGGYWGYNT